MTGPQVPDALAAIPRPSDRRLAVRLTPDALRQVRAGHPWVFDGSISSISEGGRPGDLAVVFDGSRAFAAIGLYDPDSPIRVRVLHAGRPVPIDATWWRAALRSAIERRATFRDDPHSADLAYRVVHGENDGFPGLVVDRYAAVLVVKLYSAAWFPHLPDVVPLLVDETGAAGVVVRLARNVRRGPTHGLADGDTIAGDVPPGPVAFTEGGLAFEADVRRGQKTGHFLDQRANRLRVGAMAGGCDVLDVFAATGGFTVHAAAGGARSVHALDRSAPTLGAARRNVELNRHLDAVRACRTTFEVGDAFEAMDGLERRGRTYDLVVVDPPSFAPRQADVAAARRSYERLTRLALGLIRAGGVLVQASCSARVGDDEFYETVLDAAASAGRELREIERTGHDVDHPVGFREGAYLKAGFWRVG